MQLKIERAATKGLAIAYLLHTASKCCVFSRLANHTYHHRKPLMFLLIVPSTCISRLTHTNHPPSIHYLPAGWLLYLFYLFYGL